MHFCLFDKPIESLLFMFVLFMFCSHVFISRSYKNNNNYCSIIITVSMDCAVFNLAKLDSAIHRMNLYALDRAIGFSNTYPL